MELFQSASAPARFESSNSAARTPVGAENRQFDFSDSIGAPVHRKPGARRQCSPHAIQIATLLECSLLSLPCLQRSAARLGISHRR